MTTSPSDEFPNPVGRIFHGNCYNLLKLIRANSVRLLLTDLPYNVARSNNFHTMSRGSIDFEWDCQLDHLAWLEEADRTLMPGGSLVCFYDWKKISHLTSLVEDELGYGVKRPIIWRKTSAWPRNTERSPVQCIEMGFWAVKPGASWIFNKREDASYETYLWFDAAAPRMGKGAARHEALKPLDLFEQLIEILSNPGELVVDPFAGQGTTAVAAEKLGRQHISFEITEKWAIEAQRRLKEIRG